MVDPNIPLVNLHDDVSVARARRRIYDTESDFYALLMFNVLSKLMPEKTPDQIASAVIQAYKQEEVATDHQDGT